jgi:hypothetical protein
MCMYNTSYPPSLYESNREFLQTKADMTAADSLNESNEDDKTTCLGFLVYLLCALRVTLSSQTFNFNDHYDIVSYSVCSDHSQYLQLPYSFLLSWLLSYNLLWSLSYQLKWSLSPKYSTIASLSPVTVVTLTSRVEATVTPIPQCPLLHQWQRPFSDPNHSSHSHIMYFGHSNISHGNHCDYDHSGLSHTNYWTSYKSHIKYCSNSHYNYSNQTEFNYRIIDHSCLWSHQV